MSLDFKIPEITSTPIRETRTRFIPDPPPPPPRRGDPLAQSFFVDQPGGNVHQFYRYLLPVQRMIQYP